MAGQDSGGGSGGGGGGPDQFPEVYAARLSLDQRSMVYFATALSAMMGIFIIFHFTRIIAQKLGVASGSSILAAPFVYVSRILRRSLIHKFPLLPTTGHAWLALAYVVLNLVLTFTPLVDHPVMSFQSNIASRTGWLATANICLAVFLGLKNTPLGYLTTWSYERLNILHQIVGYTAMALTVIHGAAYAAYFIDLGAIARLRVEEEIYGIVSGFTMLTLVVVGFTIRRWWYEMFYIIHVSFFILTMVFLGLHQPETHKKILQATLVGAGIWLADRIIRVVRLTLYSLNNSATVYPLPQGGTKIIMRKAPYGARAGEHCFVWIPKIRSIEMHPFTMAAADPLEFVAASYDGFTQELHNYASKNPGAVLKASVEGSYGAFPDPTAYNKIVLVAGGSGASFTVGMALNLLNRVKPGSQQSIVFVWAVRDYDHLEWFSGHLATIRHTLNSSVSLYVTRSPRSLPPALSRRSTDHSSTSDGTNTATEEKAPIEDEKSFAPVNATADDKAHAQRPTRIFTSQLTDPEKPGNESEAASPISPASPYAMSLADSSLTRQQQQQDSIAATHLHGIPISYSRPDVSRIVRDSVESTPTDGRVLVMGCGPEALMAEMRETTAKCITMKGPAVELHVEQFGW